MNDFTIDPTLNYDIIKRLCYELFCDNESIYNLLPFFNVHELKMREYISSQYKTIDQFPKEFINALINFDFNPEYIIFGIGKKFIDNNEKDKLINICPQQQISNDNKDKDIVDDIVNTIDEKIDEATAYMLQPMDSEKINEIFDSVLNDNLLIDNTKFKILTETQSNYFIEIFKRTNKKKFNSYFTNKQLFDIFDIFVKLLNKNEPIPLNNKKFYYFRNLICRILDNNLTYEFMKNCICEIICNENDKNINTCFSNIEIFIVICNHLYNKRWKLSFLLNRDNTNKLYKKYYNELYIKFNYEIRINFIKYTKNLEDINFIDNLIKFIDNFIETTTITKINKKAKNFLEKEIIDYKNTKTIKSLEVKIGLQQYTTDELVSELKTRFPKGVHILIDL